MQHGTIAFIGGDDELTDIEKQLIGDRTAESMILIVDRNRAKAVRISTMMDIEIRRRTRIVVLKDPSDPMLASDLLTVIQRFAIVDVDVTCAPPVAAAKVVLLRNLRTGIRVHVTTESGTTAVEPNRPTGLPPRLRYRLERIRAVACRPADICRRDEWSPTAPRDVGCRPCRGSAGTASPR